MLHFETIIQKYEQETDTKFSDTITIEAEPQKECIDPFAIAEEEYEQKTDTKFFNTTFVNCTIFSFLYTLCYMRR